MLLVSCSEGLTGGMLRAGGALKYRTSGDFGAVLVTKSTIERKSFTSDSPVKNWYKANVKALLQGKWAADIRERGLFVITQTYSTEKCSLTSWTNPQHEIVVRIDVGGVGAGHVGAEYSYSAAAAAGGWNHYESKVCGNIFSFVAGFLG
jgi:hypothetical protein